MPNYHVVLEFDRKFFAQCDNGYIVENDLIRELERLGEQVDKEDQE